MYQVQCNVGLQSLGQFQHQDTAGGITLHLRRASYSRQTHTDRAYYDPAGQTTAGKQVCIEYACLGEVHQASTKALDLLIGSDGTEGNFPKALLMEGPVRDATHNIPFSPHNCN